jgi:isopenicillin-N epimerase
LIPADHEFWTNRLVYPFGVATDGPRFGRAAQEDWGLEPGVTYLNHGTVGVVPLAVLEAQQALRLEIERHPARFLLRELAKLEGVAGWPGEPRLRTAARAVAEFVGARGDDLAFVDNASSGANAVLRSLRLEAGDEILVTDEGYGGVTLAARFAAREAGAEVVVANLRPTDGSSAEIVEAVDSAITARTRVAIIDHLTSDTARLLPLAEVAARCHSAGVGVMADGAHVPGQLPLDIESLGVDWYVANLHKWAWAPRGTGIIWARPDRQSELHPPVVSWGLDKGFTTEFDWTGTRDPSGWLTAPFAIELMKKIGLDAIRAHNHALAWNGAQQLAETWQTRIPGDESWYGSMVTVPLPEAMGASAMEASALRDALHYEDGIEVPISARDGRLWVRVAAQVYTEDADFDRLGRSVQRRLAAAGVAT